MPVADAQPVVESQAKSAVARWAALGLFAILAAYSATTLDDYPLVRFLLGGVTLAGSAVFLTASFRQPLRLSVPSLSLLLMVVYGTVQSVALQDKVAFYGWTKTAFWLTAALIALVASQVFAHPPNAKLFRYAFALFSSCIALLDLLEQASHTTKYFWLIQSRWPQIYGTFAYHNNFAQLIELSLPVTLWIGLGHRKPNLLFVLLGALQVGAVAAASSRAGLALILLELIAVALIAYRRHRQRSVVMTVGVLLLLSVLFIFIAGAEGVLAKLTGDQLLVRREINKSSLAMISERPLTGWGLGSYMYVYPMFARYDDGTYVNQAHNDWLEWAAEGGISFALPMLIVFIWSVRPAVRSVWGIGLLALCLNAAVDYPFARFGVCGWYFALAGMLAVQSDESHRKRPRTAKTP